MAEVARENTDDYLMNLAGLGVDQIDKMPRATESMRDIIAMTQALIERGFAYEVNGDVFFDVTSDPNYGKLTNRTIDALHGEGGEAAAKKRSAADFALWKVGQTGRTVLGQPLGPGTAGLAHRVLGHEQQPAGPDIRHPRRRPRSGLPAPRKRNRPERVLPWPADGKVLAPQRTAEAVSGRQGRRARRSERRPVPGRRRDSLTLEQIQQATAQKESRSAGAGGLAAMIERFGGEPIRFFLLRTHYRSTVLFSDDALQESTAALDTFYRFFERLSRVTGRSFYDLPVARTRDEGAFDPGTDRFLQEVQRCQQEFLAKMDDDFNTGAAISDLFELARLLNKFVDQNELEDVRRPIQRTCPH